jgi:hypothetical protein
MTAKLQFIVDAAQRLSPSEQLELIQTIFQSWQHRFQQTAVSRELPPDSEALPAYVNRTPPVADLQSLAADFWPEDESADEINAFIAQQRAEDRAREL